MGPTRDGLWPGLKRGVSTWDRVAVVSPVEGQSPTWCSGPMGTAGRKEPAFAFPQSTEPWALGTEVLSEGEVLGELVLPVKPPLGSVRAADGDRPGEESPGCAEAQVCSVRIC